MTFALTSTNEVGLRYQVASSFGTGPMPIDQRQIHLSPDLLLYLTTWNAIPGLFLNYAVNEIFSVQPELLFVMKGTKHEQLENTAYHLTYFEVPLLVKLSLPTDAAFVPHAFVGPSFNFLMDATEEYINFENDVKDYFNSLDYGMVVGTGIDYMIGKGRLLLDFRYTFSLTNILEEEENEDDDELKNSGIVFMAGYGYTF